MAAAPGQDDASTLRAMQEEIASFLAQCPDVVDEESRAVRASDAIRRFIDRAPVESQGRGLLCFIMSLLSVSITYAYVLSTTPGTHCALFEELMAEYARVGRVQVRDDRFLSFGNANGQSYCQWLFENADDFQFRRALRVKRATFQYLEERLSHLLAPRPGSFRGDAISAREKIALSLHYLGSRGTNAHLRKSLCEFISQFWIVRLCRAHYCCLCTQVKCFAPAYYFARGTALAMQSSINSSTPFAKHSPMSFVYQMRPNAKQLRRGCSMNGAWRDASARLMASILLSTLANPMMRHSGTTKATAPSLFWAW